MSSRLMAEKTRAAEAANLEPDEGDLLLGGKNITQFLRVLLNDPTLPEQRVYRWLARRYIPYSTIGVQKAASKSTLRAHFRDPTVAEPPK
jgi:hypothetical protein